MYNNFARPQRDLLAEGGSAGISDFDRMMSMEPEPLHEHILNLLNYSSKLKMNAEFKKTGAIILSTTGIILKIGGLVCAICGLKPIVFGLILFTGIILAGTGFFLYVFMRQDMIEAFGYESGEYTFAAKKRLFKITGVVVGVL